jgi:hypothetical protein
MSWTRARSGVGWQPVQRSQHLGNTAKLSPANDKLPGTDHLLHFARSPRLLPVSPTLTRRLPDLPPLLTIPFLQDRGPRISVPVAGVRGDLGPWPVLAEPTRSPQGAARSQARQAVCVFCANLLSLGSRSSFASSLFSRR